MMAEEQYVSSPQDSVWRIGRLGLLVSSIPEEAAAELAGGDLDTIFFFAEFDTRELSHDENTIIKVYEALRKAGVSEQQAKDAMIHMQNDGLYFREASRASN